MMFRSDSGMRHKCEGHFRSRTHETWQVIEYRGREARARARVRVRARARERTVSQGS